MSGIARHQRLLAVGHHFVQHQYSYNIFKKNGKKSGALIV